MNPRDLLSKKRESDAPRPDLHLELTTADHEEPTWEVRPAEQAARRRRLDRRTRNILGAAAAAAIVVNVGAAWAYWHLSASRPSSPVAGTAVELTLRARNDLNVSLTPGRSGNLTVTVTNEYDFPIQIQTVRRGAGNIVADDEHREAGCLVSGVTTSRSRFDVSWEVPRNTIGAFTITDGLQMSRSAAHACQGAVFTVPLQVTGYRISNG